MHRTETPPRPAPAAGQRGFTVIEVTLALFVTAEIIVAGLALFDFHNKLARVQALSDLRQLLGRGRGVGRRQAMQQHLGVAGRREDRSAILELQPELGGIRQIAIVREPDRRSAELHQQRLRIVE